MSPSTKKDKRSVYERYCATVGHLPFKKLRKADIVASQMKRVATPGAADKFVKYIKTLFNWAIEEDLVDFNPANGIKKVNKSDGFHSWSEYEIAKFRQFYPLGTTARLALELMLNLGVRRSDLVKLGFNNISHHRIEFVPQKGSSRFDTKLLSLPIADELQAALDRINHNHSMFLITDYGKPFSVNGFGNKMRAWCDAISLTTCSAHGLRKASASILAEAGASEAQLMAIFGWTDGKMAQHYTKAAQSKRMIDAGFARRKSYLAEANVPLSAKNISSETKKGKNYE